MTPLRLVRLATIAICVVGIAGMIIGSLADNNNGAVITFGLITAVSVVVLMAVAATARATTASAVAMAIDDAVAEDVETRIQRLVEAGTDETALRELVRESLRMVRPAPGSS